MSTSLEREIIFTGIGGQGIQLMARILAQAAANEGQHVMLFGLYDGAMRGSSSESTLVVGPESIQAPPIVPQCWSVVAMHPQALAALALKLRPDGRLFFNRTLIPEPPRPEIASVAVPATQMAEEAGNIMGAAMVMLGAFVASTSLVSAESLVGAMRAALPPHRRRMVDTNAALLRLGTDFIRCGGSNDAGLSTRNSGM